MKNKRQEIINLIKKALSLSLIALFVTVNLTGCIFFPGSTAEPEYDMAEFGDIIDPNAYITQEQIDKAEEAKKILFAYEHDLRDEGIGMIKILKPINLKSDIPAHVRIATEDNILTHYLEFEVDKKTVTALAYLTENCEENNISGIENIKYTPSMSGDIQYITVTFSDKHCAILQNYFNLIAPFMDSFENTYLNGVDAITSKEKSELLSYLQNYCYFTQGGIASVNLLKSLPIEDNSNITYALKLKDRGSEIYTIDISEEQYNRFNKYLNIEKLALPKKNTTDVKGKKWEQQSLKLETNHYISDTLKAQVLNDAYEILKENNLINSNNLEQVQ